MQTDYSLPTACNIKLFLLIFLLSWGVLSRKAPN